MSFLIQNAWAAGSAGGGEPSTLMSLLPLVVLFILFYFLLIRPQVKRAKEHRKMVESLSKGDEVATNGGLLGRITEIGENYVELEIADQVVVKVQRQSVSNLLPKGTIKKA